MTDYSELRPNRQYKGQPEALDVAEAPYMRVTLRFDDSAGRTWFRHPKGRLHRVDDREETWLRRRHNRRRARLGYWRTGESDEFSVDA